MDPGVSSFHWPSVGIGRSGGSRDLQPEQLVFVLKMCSNRHLRA